MDSQGSKDGGHRFKKAGQRGSREAKTVEESEDTGHVSHPDEVGSPEDCLDAVVPFRVKKLGSPVIADLETSAIADRDDLLLGSPGIDDLEIRTNWKIDSLPRKPQPNQVDIPEVEYHMRPEVYRAVTSGNIAFFENHHNDRDVESWDDFSKQESPRGDTILHIAARSGHESLVRLILEYHLKLAKRKNSIGNLPLHEAASVGHLSIVQILLSHHAPATQMLRGKNQEDDSALHLALRNRHKEVARFLFDKDSELTNHLNSQEESPLHMAIEAGYEDLFELMIEKFFPENDKWSKLVSVAINGKKRGILSTLLNKWPDLDFKKTEYNPVSDAALIGYLDGVGLILDKHFAMSYVKEKEEGLYPIHMAAKKGHVEILEELLKLCPDSRELRNNKNQNILHLAAKCGKTKAVSYILKNTNLGLLINERDCEGNTPLHLAAENDRPMVVSILTWDSRVELEPRNNSGMTPLVVAENYRGDVVSVRKRLTWQALRNAGAGRAPRKSTKSFREGTQKMDFYKDRVNTLLLVSTLVVTIVFAAGFVAPGNFNTSESKEGRTTLFQKFIFHLFVISNTIALYTSITAVVALIWAQLDDLRLAVVSLKFTLPVLGISLAMVSVSFMTGVYLMVSKYNWLAILVLVLGSIGFLSLVVLFAPLCSPSSLKSRIARHIFYYPFYLLVKVTKSDADDNCEEEKFLNDA